jgi:hypothetical protein
MEHNLRATSRPAFAPKTLFLAAVESSDPPRGLKRAAPASSSASSPKRSRAASKSAVKVLHSGPTSDAARVLAFWAGHELESSDGAGHALKSPDAKRAKSSVPKRAAKQVVQTARMRDPKSAANPPNFPLRDAKYHKSDGEMAPKKRVIKYREEDIRVGGVLLTEGDPVEAVNRKFIHMADGCRHFLPATVIETKANGFNPWSDDPFDSGMEVLVTWEPGTVGACRHTDWVPLDWVPKP